MIENRILTLSGFASARRRFLTQASAGTLSAAAVALLGDFPTAGLAAQESGDVSILNVALALEYEGIAAYQIGAESGLLKKPALDTAVLFQSHHKQHAETLIGAIRKLGGKPVADKSMDEYKKSAKLNIASIKTDIDVLKLAQRLELGATNAYLGVIPAFGSKDLAKVSGRLAADETMHYTALTQALGQALPAQAMSFGA
jgi:hypothetical protein